MSANKSRIDPDVDGDAHIFYDNADDDAGWRDDDTGYRRRRPSPAGWWQRRHWLVFAAAFMIPFGVLALGLAAASHFDDSGGADTPVVGVSPTPSAAVVGQWPPDVNFVANTVPAMIRDDIATVGAQRGYQFDGRAGETWRITVEPEGDFDPEIRLYEPEGSELAYSDDLAGGSLAAEIVVILPADGTYRLLVEAVAKGNGLTGTYWLSVFEE